MNDDEKRALRYAFTFALVSAVATETVKLVCEEARELLKRRREEKTQAPSKPETKDAG